uniref:RNA cytidine acetyltransferase n=1 Tax=Ditylenchus dipsaci TaxID=166011 RepID=A0A915DH43_9BILA
MGRTKLDNRIRTLIENGVKLRHRSMFVVIGNKAKDQVVILHHILAKATVSARPSVLWCYKKELGFSSNRKKRIKEIEKKKAAGAMHAREDDPFELFISSTEVRYCYYSESHKILGNTFGMLVLQDFEALTPNLLARTVETVEGGGLVVFLLQSVDSLRQLYTLTMDVHSRYRTEAHTDIVARFNERFILSLGSCRSCVVMDDTLNVLPISSHLAKIEPVPTSQKNEVSPQAEELKSLQSAMEDTKPIGSLLKRCKTACQAKVLLKLLDVITEKTLDATCSITAARGRGKSAALGLAIAGAIGFEFTNIFVTSPTPENLRTLFEFVVKGLEAMDYQEHADFEVLKSNDKDLNKAVVRINVFRAHRQTIQYIQPNEAGNLGQAELLVIDEAAAIPMLWSKLLFLVRIWCFWPRLSMDMREAKDGPESAQNRKLHELTLEESIRYNSGDNIEQWLNKVLCLDSVNLRTTISGTPSPKGCKLYYVNRDTLFSFHKASEIFLANMMSIYVSAHYKNTPNDLQMLSDAPAHHLFVLMAPVDKESTSIPPILAVVQVCLEGSLTKKNVTSSLDQGKRAAGDLLPWTISQQFLDSDFPTLSGVRVVRVAVHPDFQGMGYGSRAMELVEQYYKGDFQTLTGSTDDVMDVNHLNTVEDTEEFSLLDEQLEPRANLPPLLIRLDERRPEQLDYLGVYVPVYLRQVTNDLTGEHTCIMLKTLTIRRTTEIGDTEEQKTANTDGTWLQAYFQEFRHRFVSLLGYCFSNFTPHLALSLMSMKSSSSPQMRLKIFCQEKACQSMVDRSLVMDLIPVLASIYFNERIEVELDLRQAAILLCVGLQRKTVEETSDELNLPINQASSLLYKAILHLSGHFDTICKKSIEDQMSSVAGKEKVQQMLDGMQPTVKSLEEDLREAEEEIKARQTKDRNKLKKELGNKLLSEFSIQGDDEEWQEAVGKIDLKQAKSGIISVKSNRQPKQVMLPSMEDETKKGAQRKRKRHSLK